MTRPSYPALRPPTFPCPCGRMTVNDCAGECGFPEADKRDAVVEAGDKDDDDPSCLVCDGTQVANDGKPCWSCVDDVTPEPEHRSTSDKDLFHMLAQGGDPYFPLETPEEGPWPHSFTTSGSAISA